MKYVVVGTRIPFGRGYASVLSESGYWIRFGEGAVMVFTERPTNWRMRAPEDEIITLEEYQMLVMEREIIGERTDPASDVIFSY